MKLFTKRKRKPSPYDEEGLDGFDWYEGQTRWPLHRILETAFGIISAIVFAVIFFRIFSSGNSEFEEMILLNERAAAVYTPGESQVVRIHPNTSDQEDDSAFLYYPVYLEETENLQFTARVRQSKIPKGKSEAGYTFVVRETSEGETRYYELSYFEDESRFGYTFYRLCFEGVEMDFGGVYTFLIFRDDYVPEEGVYEAGDAEFTFTLLNSETYYHSTVPKRDIFKTAS
ncbi:MAG: hypothetical protein IKD31_03340 [Clostridia bacterium]|nr:hypothetical protein [Clostridia bacterium]